MSIQLDNNGNYVFPIVFNNSAELEEFVVQVKKPLEMTIESKVKRFKVTGMLYLVFGAVAGFILSQFI